MNRDLRAREIAGNIACIERKRGRYMNRMSILGVVGLLVAISPAYGSLGGPRSLLDLERSADLIVVATATSTFQAGPQEEFSLQVVRVVKGDPSLAGSVLAASIANGTYSALPAITAAGNGLWFLLRSSNGWLLLPVQQGNVPLSMSFFPEPVGPVLSAYAYGTTASLSDRIASEICFAIEGTSGSLPEQLIELQYGSLDELNSPVVVRYYQRMSTSASVQQQIVGLSGLVRGGSGAALATSAQAASTFGTYPLENGILLQSIRDDFRAADATSIAALGQAAVDSASPTAFREAVAHALAAIHTLQTLPYLSTLLDDTDANLRVEAVGGLGAFANGLPAQTAVGVSNLAYLQLPPNAPFGTADTLANFAMGSNAIQRNEAAYLSFWRQWWSEQRTALGF
jgi:hypothetical protein